MDYEEIDQKIFQAAMNLSAKKGWRNFTLIEAGKLANIPLETVRERFPCKAALLFYLNRIADQSALHEDNQQQQVSEYLFDSLMRRFDCFQLYREGIISVLRILPFDPPLAFALSLASQNSMRWIANAAGINTRGVRGIICIKGLAAIWAYSLKYWMKDQSADLSATMAALDKSIKKAGNIAPYVVGKSCKNPSENNHSSEVLSVNS